MKRIVFITPEDARYGFSLAGVIQVCSDALGIVDTLVNVTADEEVGVVFVDERLHYRLEAEWLQKFEKHWPGIVVVLPAPAKMEAVAEDYAMQLIVKAIGYQARLQV